ncbi:hypothetical protein EIP91_000350 [Steccherinum ochraceum]|uniref:Uncharacterized protein n=1 Tax=Steccherinum ochraceum TaxID=92696 RepID=A0A4R0RG57_9APHY|nr:hypothetical protein EIP91_000350 [Steccherinum ochraceum]
MEDPRPAKRPRLEKRTTSTVVAPAFHSAFDVPQEKSKPRAPPKFDFSVAPASASASKPKARSLKILRPPPLPSAQPRTPTKAQRPVRDAALRSDLSSTSASSSTPHRGIAIDSPKRRVLSIPVAPLTQSPAKAGTSKPTPKRTFASLRPPVPVASPVKRHAPPPPPAPLPSGSTTPMKPMKPPSLSATTDGKSKPRNAISETNLAKRMNPLNDDGGTALLELSLMDKTKDQEVMWVNREEKELWRGLIVSPEKAGKGKRKGEGKYVSGGLASNAARVFSNSRNDLDLWYMDISRSLEDTSTSKQLKAKPILPKPSLRLQILTTLYTSPPPPNHASSSSSHPLIVLTRCVVLSSTHAKYKPKPRRFIPFGTPQPVVDDRPRILVLFRVDDPLSDKGILSRSVNEGAEMWVWQPWMDVAVREGDAFGSAEAMGLPDGVDVVDNEVLFCTRFCVAVKEAEES